MIRYLTLHDILTIYQQVMAQSGGLPGIRMLAAIESALAQPRLTFDGSDLYPTIPDKAAILGFALIQNHPFIDGNKRLGHAAMEVFLILNGYELVVNMDEQEAIIFQLATGTLTRSAFTAWVHRYAESL